MGLIADSGSRWKDLRRDYRVTHSYHDKLPLSKTEDQNKEIKLVGNNSSPRTSKEENLAHIFEELREEKALPPVPEEDEIDDILEETITDGLGRVVSLHRTPAGWIAAVEPWEQMRQRNRESRSWAPPQEGENVLSLTRIAIDESDGKFRFKIAGV